MNPNKLPDSLRMKWRGIEVDAVGIVGILAGTTVIVLLMLLMALPYLRTFWG